MKSLKISGAGYLRSAKATADHEELSIVVWSKASVSNPSHALVFSVDIVDADGKPKVNDDLDISYSKTTGIVTIKENDTTPVTEILDGDTFLVHGTFVKE